MSEDKGYAEVVEHGARLGRRSVLLAMQIRRQVIRDIGPPDPVAHPYSQGLYGHPGGKASGHAVP